MKISNKVPSSGYKRILVPTGIMLFLFAGFFGVLKFNDIFSGSSSNEQLANQSEQKNASEKTDSESLKDQQKQNTEESVEKPDQENNAQNPSISEAGNDWWIVNKTRPLSPENYQPEDLVFPSVTLRVPGNESMKIRTKPAKAIEQMFSDAKTAGHNPMFSSGFRSYNYQVNLYNSYVNSQGRTEADKQSARPGYSEHQTGLAFDICNSGNCKLEQSFEGTPLGQWVANNAHRYGFTIRYRQGKDSVTGYMYEPWHLRYVGNDLATKLYQDNTTMEEYFGLPNAPNYLQ